MERQVPPTGPRLALKRLRDAMARPLAAQEKLDQVVRIVAAEMVAEVCSVYVLRAGDILELFATQGLKTEAVHRTRLRIGEGLVGTIAASELPLALADAQSHPNFAYRPETGEEIFHSLAGAPILRGGRLLGVLVVQNRTRRQYDEEEIETLQTVAMVLAELVASGELVSPGERQQVDGIGLLPWRVSGAALTPGVAVGRAVLHEAPVVITRIVAEDIPSEHARLAEALAAVRGDLDRLLEAEHVQDGEHREILETFRMFADDRGWTHRIDEAVDSGLTAEAAVQRVFEDQRARLQHATDPYLRERLSDFAELTKRLIGRLTGRSITADTSSAPAEMIVIARDMGPAELLDYDRAKLRGVVLEEGSPLSHVAIVARALDIPLVGRAEGILQKIEAGDAVVVDGDNAQVFIRPAEEVLAQVQETIELRDARKRRYAELRHEPAVTLDGQRVKLMMNAGLLIDLTHLEETGADGVGLYRTEIPFMVRSEFPDLDSQTEVYGRLLDAAGGLPVHFRTLDVGGDKVLPYVGDFGDENPAMGWRAIRIGLDRPAMLRLQLRAMIRAANGRPLSLMFPMISEVAEFRAARRLLDIELERAERQDVPTPSRLRVGAMVEVPALLFQLPGLLSEADFLSVGSNDLMQFLFAADRGNPRLAGRYDSLSPAPLRALRGLVEAGARHGREVSLCGEMAGQPLDALALLGLGFRTLSMNHGSIGPVKAMLRSIDVGAFGSFLAARLEGNDDRSLRDAIRLYAGDHGVVLA